MPNPEEPTAGMDLYNQGFELARHGDYRAALAAFEESFRSHAHFKTLEQMGICHEKLGSQGEALRCFEQAFQLNPRNCKTGTLLARCLFRAGKPEQAATILKRVLACSKDYGPAKRLLSVVRARGEEPAMPTKSKKELFLRMFEAFCNLKGMGKAKRGNTAPIIELLREEECESLADGQALPRQRVLEICARGYSEADVRNALGIFSHWYQETAVDVEDEPCVGPATDNAARAAERSLVAKVRRMARRGSTPCEIVREIMRGTGSGRYEEVPVIACLAEAFSLSVADVKVVGAWHEFGNAKRTDAEIDQILGDLLERNRAKWDRTDV